MSSKPFDAGDVVWAPDPYNSGDNPRPWLVLAAETLPYAGEEYICAGLTLSDLPDNIEVRDEDWAVGNAGDNTSYCSPWVLSTIKHDAIASAQGTFTDEFTGEVVEQTKAYFSTAQDGLQ
jgi:hypothetical protein